MKYVHDDGRTFIVPDGAIEKLRKGLGLTEKEAILVYLEDEGKLDNEEQEALEQKAKDNRITATIHEARAEVTPKTQRERVLKPDPTKENLISAIAEMLPIAGATNVAIANPTKIITFELGGDDFKLDLIRHKKKKGEG